jgi:hypothetical protein
MSILLFPLKLRNDLARFIAFVAAGLLVSLVFERRKVKVARVSAYVSRSWVSHSCGAHTFLAGTREASRQDRYFCARRGQPNILMSVALPGEFGRSTLCFLSDANVEFPSYTSTRDHRCPPLTTWKGKRYIYLELFFQKGLRSGRGWGGGLGSILYM